MKKRSVNKLRNRFPNLFPGREFYYKGEKRIRPYSIDVGYGWHRILWKLCEKIERTLDNLPEDEQNGFAVIRVKEKFGGLRFYINADDEKKHWVESIRLDIKEAHRKSTRTCEVCGLPGKVRQDIGWWKCYCVFHYQLEKNLRRAFGPYYQRSWETYYQKNLRKIKEVIKW